MRPYLAFAAQGFRQMTAYRMESLLGLLSNLTYFVMFLAIWRVLLDDDPVGRAEMAGYVFITRLLAEFFSVPAWEMSQRFKEGDIAVELLRPLSYPMRVLADFLGRALYRVLQGLPVFLVAAWLVPVQFPDGLALLALGFSVLAAWLVNGLLHVATLSLALWTGHFGVAEHLLMTFTTLLGGWFLPLWVMPDWVQPIARVLPFAQTYYVPAAIFTGRLAGADLLAALGMQATWVLALALLVTWEWRAGAKKLTVHGG